MCLSSLFKARALKHCFPLDPLTSLFSSCLFGSSEISLLILSEQAVGVERERLCVCARFTTSVFCVCAGVCACVQVCVPYRPLICMSSIGSYINHTVIKATGHTETQPNQCWVNNSPLQIFRIFFSFVEQPVHVSWKWGGSGWVLTLRRSAEVNNYPET